LFEKKKFLRHVERPVVVTFCDGRVLKIYVLFFKAVEPLTPLLHCFLCSYFWWIAAFCEECGTAVRYESSHFLLNIVSPAVVTW